MVTVYLFLTYCAIALIGITCANTCPNRYYCHTNEIKYRSFTQLNGTYLNSSHVIKSLPITEPVKCLRQCTTSSRCQSINHYLEIDKNQLFCDLIDGNKWTNASLLQKRSSSTHYFIKSPCSSNPCRNGGTCIPQYQTGEYACSCPAKNYTVWITGKHCQNMKVAEETASVYYPFKEGSLLVDQKSSSGHKITLQGETKIVSVFDRLSPVMYLPGKTGSYATSDFYGRGCLARIQNCITGLGVSFWFKIREDSKRQFITGSDCYNKMQILAESTVVHTNQGFRMLMYGCKEKAFHIRLRMYSKLYAVNWGTAYNKELYRSWSHFMFTAKDGHGLFLYFNGIEVARTTTILERGAKLAQSAKLNFGGGNIGAYIADVSTWYDFLSASDVQTVYKAGLKRNLQTQASDKD